MNLRETVKNLRKLNFEHLILSRQNKQATYSWEREICICHSQLGCSVDFRKCPQLVQTEFETIK